jgi:hypothetical protein
VVEFFVWRLLLLSELLLLSKDGATQAIIVSEMRVVALASSPKKQLKDGILLNPDPNIITFVPTVPRIGVPYEIIGSEMYSK